MLNDALKKTGGWIEQELGIIGKTLGLVNQPVTKESIFSSIRSERILKYLHFSKDLSPDLSSVLFGSMIGHLT